MKKSGRNLSEHEKDRGSYTAAVVKYFKGLDKEDYGVPSLSRKDMEPCCMWDPSIKLSKCEDLCRVSLVNLISDQTTLRLDSTLVTGHMHRKH